MKRQSIHQQIDFLLSTLEEQHQRFRESHGTLPQMELDLLLQNSRQLYEAILMLFHTNALSSLDDVKAAVMQRILSEKKMDAKKPEQPEAVQPAVDEVPQKETHSIMEEITVTASEVVTSEVKTEKRPKVKRVTGGVNATLFEEQPSVADHFEDEVTLHEHIASKNSGTTVASQLHRKPLADLKAAIGINEKFLFINQLFDGNLQDYSEAISKVNSSTDFESARSFIFSELASRFNWSDSNEHVKNFMDLVERRFSR